MKEEVPLGKGVSIQCEKCGFSVTLFEGLGNRSKKFEDFRKRILKKDNEFIDYILNKENTNNIIYHDSYGKCNKCGDLTTINYIEIQYDVDKIFKLEHKCRSCEGTYNIVTLDEVLKSKCPKCHNEKLESFGNIHWE